MATTKELIWHSRASAQADWQCNRARYYQYNYLGGIQKNNLTLELFFGTVLHDALAGIAAQYSVDGAVDIDNIASSAGNFVSTTLLDYYSKGTGNLPTDSPEWLLMMEQSTLLEGLVRGFYKQRWPSLIAQYPVVVGYEKENIFPHDFTGKLNKKGPFIYKAKPDLILAEDDDSPVVYIEYKSTGNKKPEWIESWNKDMQVHGTAKAIEFTKNREVLGTIVQGLYKGYAQYGKLSSNLVYGYKGKGNPPFTAETISTEYKPGLKKFPIWEYDGGIKAWIEKLPIETLSEQFPQTPMIFTEESLAEDFFRQRAVRERDVKDSVSRLEDPETPDFEKQIILDVRFPQSFSKCCPSFGRPCDFLGLCHGPQSVKDDPVGSGKFALRDREHNDGFKTLAVEIMEGITSA
ncbi:MAG: hypothetical protein AB7J46_06635 [Candidatus Altimarinota bacterium]